MRRWLILLCLLAGCAAAPGALPPDPYSPIQSSPGLTGPQFRAAMDQRFNGTNEIDPQLGSGTFLLGLAFGAVPTAGQDLHVNATGQIVGGPIGIAVSALPASPAYGAFYAVNDCGVCTFGGPACVHSASPVAICMEVWNGSAWVPF